jgi:catechol 2,3-dioxygenase-like lactoylglutathione lyase family enzyme
MRMTSLVPMLQTHDMARTRQWYEEVLGFRCVSAGDDDGWCRLERDAVAIMFMRNDHLGAPHATATQYIYVDDVLSLWNGVKQSCTAEWGPEKMSYGLTEFAIRDPNGYLLSFGQPTE